LCTYTGVCLSSVRELGQNLQTTTIKRYAFLSYPLSRHIVTDCDGEAESYRTTRYSRFVHRTSPTSYEASKRYKRSMVYTKTDLASTREIATRFERDEKKEDENEEDSQEDFDRQSCSRCYRQLLRIGVSLCTSQQDFDLADTVAILSQHR